MSHRQGTAFVTSRKSFSCYVSPLTPLAGCAARTAPGLTSLDAIRPEKEREKEPVDPTSGHIESLRRQWLLYQQELDVMLEELTIEHPDVKRAQKKIDRHLDEIERAREQLVKELERLSDRDYAQTKSEIKRFEDRREHAITELKEEER